MEVQNLTVEIRETQGKGPARQIRLAGLVPGVVYGGGRSPLHVTINLKDFERLLHGRFGEHAVLQLEVAGKPELNSPALLKSVQRDPVREFILHADFLRIRLDERIETVVPVELVGQPAGVVAGGILERQLRELEIECLALEVPEKLEVDVSHLNIGDSVHVSAVSVPVGVKVLTDPDRPIATITVPRAVVEAAPVEAEVVEAAEGEEKKEGEAEEPQPQKKEAQKRE